MDDFYRIRRLPPYVFEEVNRAKARVAADLALTGASEVVDTASLGLDRFDDLGRSRLAADPIALPFPEQAPQQAPGKLTIS